MAGSSSDIRAGRAFIELFLKDTVQPGLLKAAARLKAFAAGVSGVGDRLRSISHRVLDPLIEAGKSFAETGSELAHLAAMTGFSVKTLSLLGAQADDVAVGVGRMDQFISQAAHGNKAAAGSLLELGLSAAQLLALSPEDQFRVLADRIAAIANPTLRAAAAMKVFGRGGAALMPLLEEGAAGIDRLLARRDKAGFGISDADVEKAKLLSRAFKELALTQSRIKFQLGASVAEWFTQIIEKVTTAERAVLLWIRANRSAVLIAAQLAAVLLTVAVTLVTVATAAQVLAFVTQGLSLAVGFCATAYAGLTVAASSAAAAVAAVWGAVLTPVGLVAAAVIGLTALFLYFSGVGRIAIEDIGRVFQSLWQTLGQTLRGMSDAIAAGDLSLAFRILGLAIKLEWQKLLAWFATTWIGMGQLVQQAVNRMTTKFVVGWQRALGIVSKIIARIGGIVSGRGSDVEEALIDARTQAAIGAAREASGKRSAHIDEKAARETWQAEAALRKAQQEFDAARAEAAQQRAKGEQQPVLPPLPKLPQLASATQGIGSTTAGIFSSFAASALGRAGPASAAERTARATELMQDELELIKDDMAVLRHKAETGGLVFA